MAKDKKPPKATPLTGLAAALVKAGALDEKKARELVREQRREEKTLGRDAVAEREAHKQAEAEARKQAEAAAARERERARQQETAAERARRVVREGLPAGGFHGARRWFFVSRSGRVPFLEVSDAVARMLAEGRAGIVESLTVVAEEHTVVVDERCLVTLIGIDRELVRFWNRGSGA